MTENVTSITAAAEKPSRDFPVRVGARRYSLGDKPKVMDLHEFLSGLATTRRSGGTETEFLAATLNSCLLRGDAKQPTYGDEDHVEQLFLFFEDLASERITEAQYHQVLDLVRQHYTGAIQVFLDFELSDAQLEEQYKALEEADGDVDADPEKEIDAAGN